MSNEMKKVMDGRTFSVMSCKRLKMNANELASAVYMSVLDSATVTGMWLWMRLAAGDQAMQKRMVKRVAEVKERAKRDRGDLESVPGLETNDVVSSDSPL